MKGTKYEIMFGIIKKVFVVLLTNTWIKSCQIRIIKQSDMYNSTFSYQFKSY